MVAPGIDRSGGMSDSRIYREALELIDRYGCETFTHGRCLDEHSGRRRGADLWRGSVVPSVHRP